MHRRRRVASRRRVRDARRRLRRPRAAARAIPTRCRRVSWAKLWVFFFERMHSKRARQVARHSRTRRSMSRSPWGESRAACVPSSSSVREMDGCVVARVRASRRNVNDAVDAVHDECAPVRDENGDTAADAARAVPGLTGLAETLAAAPPPKPVAAPTRGGDVTGEFAGAGGR